MAQDRRSRQFKTQYVIVPIIIALIGGLFLVISTYIGKGKSSSAGVTVTNGVGAGGDVKTGGDIIINK